MGADPPSVHFIGRVLLLPLMSVVALPPFAGGRLEAVDTALLRGDIITVAISLSPTIY